jgi:hypothetical protein
VLVLGVVLLIVQSTTGLLMSPGCGGYQSTTPPYHTTRPVTTSRPQIITPELIPELLHRSPEVILFPELQYEDLESWHRGSQVLHQQGTRVLHNYKCRVRLPHLGSQVLLCSQLFHRSSSYYTPKTVKYYKEAIMGKYSVTWNFASISISLFVNMPVIIA